MSDWIQGRVVGKHHWTDELYSLRIEAAVEPFRAGQFTRLALDIDGERVGRPYSYVNAPDEHPLEFYFITIPHGPLTDRLRQLRIGDPIWVGARAGGFFTLAAVPDARHLWLFASGTALGVFLSQLKTDEPWRRFDKIILAHGVRTAGELTYRNEIARFSETHGERFVYVPFVSREETDFALSGRIPDAILDGRLERRAGVALTATTCQVMICGNPDMVRDTAAVLEGRGLKKNRRTEPGQITTENYW
ncbi:MAG: ferredoxin--NADP reductase [Gammaproteobacteria bacterium]|nr:ferredoxin--NADP reductase [Gammaproteobacteria bacterium]